MKDDKNEFPCNRCDKKETSKSDLLIHMDLVHKAHDEMLNRAERPNPAMCRNGENCSWHRNNRCKFQFKQEPGAATGVTELPLTTSRSEPLIQSSPAGKKNVRLLPNVSPSDRLVPRERKCAVLQME